MEKTLKGITISSIDHGESDKFITILTAERGLIFVLARGVKKNKAKLKYATEPFCFGDFELIEKRGRYILTGCEMNELFYDLREDIEKYYLASGIVEIIKRIAPEGQESIRELVFLVNALKRISLCKKKLFALAIKLTFEVISLTGYGIVDFSCIECGSRIERKVFFDYSEGGFLCETHANGHIKMKIKVYKQLQTIVESNDDELINIIINKDDCKDIFRFLIKYQEYKLQFRDKSLIEYIKIMSY